MNIGKIYVKIGIFNVVLISPIFPNIVNISVFSSFSLPKSCRPTRRYKIKALFITLISITWLWIPASIVLSFPDKMRSLSQKFQIYIESCCSLQKMWMRTSDMVRCVDYLTTLPRALLWTWAEAGILNLNSNCNFKTVVLKTLHSIVSLVFFPHTCQIWFFVGRILDFKTCLNMFKLSC